MTKREILNDVPTDIELASFQIVDLDLKQDGSEKSPDPQVTKSFDSVGEGPDQVLPENACAPMTAAHKEANLRQDHVYLTEVVSMPPIQVDLREQVKINQDSESNFDVALPQHPQFHSSLDTHRNSVLGERPAINEYHLPKLDENSVDYSRSVVCSSDFTSSARNSMSLV